ncbi:sulfur carrier protein ThiS adenylyltransferase ThiF [Candidatus Fermentibacteria bacterium]|nr:sulfur carrier protein ThiS adenylyltransferase ThiF [Candidatus Fermentibacteria bacterium]
MGRSMEIFRDNPPGTAEKLSLCRAGIAGAGGIGSNAALLLARSGIGSLVIADFDRVETANLNRQAYRADQAGRLKVEALSENLALIDPGLEVLAFPVRLDRSNICGIFEGCHVLVEALDLDESKHMLLECWMRGLPDVPIVAVSGIAGAGPAEEIVTDRRRGLSIVGDRHSHLRSGTLATRVGVAAALAAHEAVRILLEGGTAAAGRSSS